MGAADGLPAARCGRLAAPVGWVHLTGGGLLLAIAAFIAARYFDRRAASLRPPADDRERGYREGGPVPPTEAETLAREAAIDVYEARARSARLVALQIVASSVSLLAAAMSRGLGS